MARRVCPGCGSTYFIHFKSDKKLILQVNSNYSLEFMEDVSIEVADTEDYEKIPVCCAACSWKGHVEDLVESHTG